MEIIIYHDYKALSIETARQISDIVAEKPDSLLCFPAGDTSIGTFEALKDMVKKGDTDFSRCKLVGLDEWVGIGEMQQENCFRFLKRHLLENINLQNENICFFNGEAADLENECTRIDQFIRNNGGIDMMLLGVGMNGHVGLNEPGVTFSSYSHIVDLDIVTKHVAQKYFSGKASLSKGITLGIKQMMEAKTVILQMSGKKKTPVVKQLLQSEITSQFPVSALKQHTNAFLLLDAQAYPEDV